MAAGRPEPVLISGFTELERDLKATGPAMLAQMRIGLEEGAEGIKEEADRLSIDNFSGMQRAKIKPPPWSQQKIGQNTKEVYMVPTEKGKRHGRTEGEMRRGWKFARRMLEQAYDPALEQGRPALIRRVNIAIGSVTKEFNA